MTALTSEPVLDARGLRHGYGRAGGVEVLHGLSLRVERGTTTAILGPSGCGKSTLLRLIAGFERPVAGSITINGRAVAGSSRFVPAERRPIGYVAQEGALFPHLSVRRNLEFGLGRSERRDRGVVSELLDLVSLPASCLDRHPHELSGGQQQRVALARMLARRPALVLLDEPFSALDTDLRVSTRAAVARALSARGVTTVLVTHDRGEALSFADSVAVMVAGRFVQVADPRTLYELPVDAAAAALVGEIVMIPGRVRGSAAVTPLGPLPLRGEPGAVTEREATDQAGTDQAGTGPVRILLRPEQISVRPADTGRGTILTSSYVGADRLVEVSWPELSRPITARVAGGSPVVAGDRVEVLIEGTALALPD